MVNAFQYCFVNNRIYNWRLRKIVLWTLCLLSLILFIYAHFTTDTFNKLYRQSPPDQYIPLHLYKDKIEREGPALGAKNRHEAMLLRNRPDEQESQSSIHGAISSSKSPREQENPRLFNDKFLTNNGSKILSLPTQNFNNDQYNPPIYTRSGNEGKFIKKLAKKTKGLENSGMASILWSEGSYSFNPFGEQVYNHMNRALYIPKRRVVHLDLKGAPPKVSTYETLIPWLAKYGATTVLIEYEEMFPWEGKLAPIAGKNHYSKDDIKRILEICKENNIEVIPLVQTFGHLEYVLKLPQFSYLRELPDIPLALCPSKTDSSWLVRTMIDQMMALHPGVKFLHIGCDEVFQLGECDVCRQKIRDELFISHVSKTAEYAIKKHKVTPIIWHDMITHISDSLMNEYEFGKLVEPMVWVYAEDVYRFINPQVFDKLAEVFPVIWTASAFKGAFGEQSTVPNIRRHLDNNLNWLDVMETEHKKFSGGIRGIVITGWQRHDHFAVLCELLPATMPSLAFNLVSVTQGYYNTSTLPQIYESLGCMQVPKSLQEVDLDNDSFQWNAASWCSFQGSSFFKVTKQLDTTKKEVRSFLDKLNEKRAWITKYNIRHNYSSPVRVDQDIQDIPSYTQMVRFLAESAENALLEWFDEWTTAEWIEQHIWPLFEELTTLETVASSMKNVKNWPARPLPIHPGLSRLGVRVPTFTKPPISQAPKENRNKSKLFRRKGQFNQY